MLVMDKEGNFCELAKNQGGDATKHLLPNNKGTKDV